MKITGGERDAHSEDFGGAAFCLKFVNVAYCCLFIVILYRLTFAHIWLLHLHFEFVFVLLLLLCAYS